MKNGQDGMYHGCTGQSGLFNQTISPKNLIYVSFLLYPAQVEELKKGTAQIKNENEHYILNNSKEIMCNQTVNLYLNPIIYHCPYLTLPTAITGLQGL